METDERRVVEGVVGSIATGASYIPRWLTPELNEE